eukprot:10554327-Alexandrium_andersonii.AAC.1
MQQCVWASMRSIGTCVLFVPFVPFIPVPVFACLCASTCLHDCLRASTRMHACERACERMRSRALA